jgi:hypothetical protein
VSFSMPSVPHFEGQSATVWAQSVAARYDPMLRMLAASYAPVPDTNASRWFSTAYMPFVASPDACAAESDSLLRWSAFSALAYGARGVFWRGAAKCAPLGSARFSLLASINKRLAQWGNTFVESRGPQDYPNGGYNISRLYSTGYELPSTVAPGSGGPSDIVQAADDNVLVALLGYKGRPGTPLLYIVDKRVDPTPGAAGVRTVRVSLRSDVTATQPVEGDCVAAHCQCGLSNLGNAVTIQLPGGSGQLVALELA